ncbi:MAG: sugar phosphate nucleotidyltransferase [Candidatus Omnitrophica bacterium]|nr:sugar phosphate nucleotidyltransferase [Candidatus Omnitrophota bacterium]
MNTNLKNIDVLILCGGLGKRLRGSVSDRPKVLAPIGGGTFLDILLKYADQFGLKKFILAVGYKSDQVEEYVRKRGYEVVFSNEESPLGTGGAIKKAEPLITSDPFLVMNGDSICHVDLNRFCSFHVEKNALVSIVTCRVEPSADYGLIAMDSSSRISSYQEKALSNKESFISAGIYLMQKEIFSYMPPKDRFSLEQDLLPTLLKKKCYAFATENGMLDIGTPDRYGKAREILREDVG